MNNKKIGNDFEKDFAEFLAKNGYWVAPFPGKAHTNAQPADLICCKNDRPYLIDCKTLENKNGIFNLSRIEENQRLAYQRYVACGNKNYSLAILWKNDIYIVQLAEIDFNGKSINLNNFFPIWRNFNEHINR